MKSHSADAVPVLIYDNLHIKQLSHQRFTENDAIDGELGFFEGRQLLQKTGLGK
jgi:2,3-bisphosphoglycerate-independent phosphoglycerate mutase